jgi:hypothetical protein
MIRKSLFLFSVPALAACALEIAGPGSSLEGLPEGLEVTFIVEPGEVDQHAPFSAQLSVTNTTNDMIQVVTAHSCLAIPNVLRNGQRVPFKGSWWGCYAAITTHSFAPSETRSMTWDMQAESYAEHPGDVDGAPAPKGSYVVQAEFDTYPADGSSRKPAVERTLRVR